MNKTVIGPLLITSIARHYREREKNYYHGITYSDFVKVLNPILLS